MRSVRTLAIVLYQSRRSGTEVKDSVRITLEAVNWCISRGVLISTEKSAETVRGKRPCRQIWGVSLVVEHRSPKPNTEVRFLYFLPIRPLLGASEQS